MLDGIRINIRVEIDNLIRIRTVMPLIPDLEAWQVVTETAR